MIDWIKIEKIKEYCALPDQVGVEVVRYLLGVIDELKKEVDVLILGHAGDKGFYKQMAAERDQWKALCEDLIKLCDDDGFHENCKSLKEYCDFLEMKYRRDRHNNNISANKLDNKPEELKGGK